MANIPQNETYQGVGSTPVVPRGISYTPKTTSGTSVPKATQGISYSPKTTYENLYKLPSIAMPTPGTPEYEALKLANVTKYGTGLFNYGTEQAPDYRTGIPTQTQFSPTVGDLNASAGNLTTPQPVPADYGTWATPGTINKDGVNLSWATPKTPVIKNITGDTGGQFIEDTTDPNLLIKTTRGRNDPVDDAILAGRPGYMYQIDHVMPLALGGADTVANRQLFTTNQHKDKTVAQSVPYTLYAYGKISLAQAREMSMVWNNRDLTDIPLPNDYGLIPDTNGKTGLQIAQDAAARWLLPKKETIKDKIAKIPEAAKNFGEGWLPDPIREFVKGAAAGFTLGLVPYEQDENETPGSWLAGKVGLIGGGVASFFTGEFLLSAAAKGAMLSYRAAAGLAAARAGLKGAQLAEEAIGLAKGASTAAKVLEGAAGVSEAAKVAEGASALTKLVGTTEQAIAKTGFADSFASKLLEIKTLNKVPGYVKGLLTPETIKGAAKMGVTSAFIGQLSQYVQNHFNVGTLSGQAFQTEQEGMIGNIMKDFAIGAVSGLGTPTVKGTAYAAALPFTLAYLNNPDDPMSAITDGVIFASMHAAGAYKRTNGFKNGFNDVEMLGGKAYEAPIIKAYDKAVNSASYGVIDHWAKNSLPPIGADGIVPKTASDPVVIQNAVNSAIKEVWTRFFLGRDVSKETQQATMKDIKTYAADLTKKIEGFREPVPTQTAWQKLMSTAENRKARTAKIKETDTQISQTLGKDFSDRVVSEFKGDVSKIGEVEGAMDLKTALTEVKRIVVAGRQLYKSGLPAALRSRADMDDLLTFTKEHQAKKFDIEQRFMYPPVAKEVLMELAPNEALAKDFISYSSVNAGKNPNSPYLQGDSAATGGGVNARVAENIKKFIAAKENGNASPNAAVVKRSELGPLFGLKNKTYTAKELASGDQAIDPYPENALQLVGFMRDSSTSPIYPVDLGFIPSEHRLNLANNAINKSQWVKEWLETNGQKGFKPIENNKDQIATEMDKNGVKVLMVNVDSRSTAETKLSKKPWVAINFNEKNWLDSMDLNKRLSENRSAGFSQPGGGPVSSGISNIIKARESKAVTGSLDDMNETLVRPTSDYISRIPVSSEPIVLSKDGFRPIQKGETVAGKYEVKVDPETGKEVTNAPIKKTQKAKLKGDTEGTFDKLQDSLNVDSPEMIKQSFQENFGVTVPDAQAQDLFSRKSTITGKEAKDLLASFEGQNMITDQRIESVNTFLRPEVVERFPDRGVFLDKPLLAGLENIAPPIKRPSGIEESAVAPEVAPVTEAPVTQPPVTQPASTPLVDKIITNAQRELPTVSKSAPASPESAATLEQKRILELAQDFITEGRAAVEQSLPKEKYTDRGSVSAHDSTILNTEQMIQSSLQGRNEPQSVIDGVKDYVKNDLRGYSESLISDQRKFRDPTSYEIYQIAKNNKVPLEDLQQILYKYNPEAKDILDTETRPQYFNELDAIETSPRNLSDAEAALVRTMKSPAPRTAEGIAKPSAAPGEFTKFIEEGLATPVTENPGAHYLAKAFDSALTSMLGPEYRKNAKLGKILSDFLSNAFSSEVSSKGLEITQPKDVLTARALGDRTAEVGAMYGPQGRMKKLSENPVGENVPFTPEDLSSMGITPEDLSISKIVTPIQEQDMVRNLTQGEDLMGALFADEAPQGAATAVRAVKRLFLGGAKGSGGLREYIVAQEPAAKRSISLDALEKEAVAIDKKVLPEKEAKIKQTEEAKTQLPSLKKQIESIKKAMEAPIEERANWQTDGLLREQLKELTDKLNSYKDLGVGGPGKHDGAGGFRDMVKGVGKAFGDGFSNLLSKTYDMTPTKIAEAESKPAYDLRGIKVTDDDLDEASHILFNEISNRDPDKQKFEINHVINTALNRAIDNPKYFGATLTQVLQKPFQYQGYSPEGMIAKGGKVIESQYQKIKSGILDAPSKKKLQVIQEALADIKNKAGEFKDTTGGSKFYVHAADGTLWLGSTIEEAKNNANTHEIRTGIKKTQWGTSVGLPVQSKD